MRRIITLALVAMVGIAHGDTPKPDKRRALVSIPKAYELASIVLALTERGRTDGNVTARGSEYHRAVMQHFGAHADHPVVKRVEEQTKTHRGLMRFRANALRYDHMQDKLTLTGKYPVVSKPDLFGQELAHLADFTRKSGFSAFYSNHTDFYQSQMSLYREQVDIERMWRWLEQHSAIRYQRYTVVFSPLTGGSHSTQRFTHADGMREAVMFVSGPRTNKVLTYARRGQLERVVFTEIDHNYVNPVTDRHARAVRQAIGPLNEWNQQNGYRNDVATFNEYMTWALFSVYASEHYAPADFKVIRQSVEAIMARRKFVQFAAFNAALLQHTQSLKGKWHIEDLYPAMLKWMAARSTPPPKK